MSLINAFLDHRVVQLPDRRLKITVEDGSEVIVGGLSKSELKTAFVLEQNVDKLFRDHSLNFIGFMTITFPKNVVTPKEASRRFNSFNTHFLKDCANTYIKVVEPHEDKRPHMHLLVVLQRDIRSGFDWDTKKRADEEYKQNGRSKTHKALTRKNLLLNKKNQPNSTL